MCIRDRSPSNNVAWAETYLPTKWHLDPSSHLATTDMGRKLGGGWPCPFLGGLAPHPTMSPGPRSTSIASGILIHPAVWPFGHNGQGRKLGSVHLWGGRAGPHLAQCGLRRGLPVYHHAKFHVDPSNRLGTIHQRHRPSRQTDRTDTIVSGLGRGLPPY